MISLLPSGQQSHKAARPFFSKTLAQTSLLLAGLLVTPAFANAESVATAETNDRLKLSPLISSRVQQSLLLDITRAGNSLVAVGERGHIIVSDDRAQSWKQAIVPSSSALTAVFFVDAEHGWAVGHDGIVLASVDGGASWEKQLDGNRINYLVLEAAEQRLTLLQRALDNTADSDQRDELELQLEEAEIALEDATIAGEEGPTAPLLDLWFKDRLNGFVVGAYGLLLETRDGGESWQTIAKGPENPDRFHYNTIAATSAGNLLIAGEAGTLYRSSDLGNSWQTLDSPYSGSYFGINTTAQDAVMLFGLRGNAFISHDQGDSWQALQSSSDASFFSSTALPDGSLLLAGGNGSLSLSDGTTLQSLPKPERRPLSGLVALDDRLVLIGAGGVSTQPLPAKKPSGANLAAQKSITTNQEAQ